MTTAAKDQVTKDRVKDRAVERQIEELRETIRKLRAELEDVNGRR